MNFQLRKWSQAKENLLGVYFRNFVLNISIGRSFPQKRPSRHDCMQGSQAIALCARGAAHEVTTPNRR